MRLKGVLDNFFPLLQLVRDLFNLKLTNNSFTFEAKRLLSAFFITFFVPYKRAGTHFSIHPAKQQYTPPSKKSLEESLVVYKSV